MPQLYFMTLALPTDVPSPPSAAEQKWPDALAALQRDAAAKVPT